MGVPVSGHAGALQPAPVGRVYLSQSVGQSVCQSAFDGSDDNELWFPPAACSLLYL